MIENRNRAVLALFPEGIRSIAFDVALQFGSHIEVDDLVQCVYVRALKSAEIMNYEGKNNLGGALWLMIRGKIRATLTREAKRLSYPEKSFESVTGPDHDQLVAMGLIEVES